MITEQTTINLGLLMVLIGLLVNIVVSFAGRKKADEAKHLELEKNFVKLNVKIDTFSQNSIALSKDLNRQAERTEELLKVSIKNSERIEAMFRKIDDHESRLTRLEREGATQ